MGTTIASFTSGENPDASELRLVRYSERETYRGVAYEEWQLWYRGVDVATLSEQQIVAAAEVAQDRKAGE